jgi:hypothetical protein
MWDFVGRLLDRFFEIVRINWWTVEDLADLPDDVDLSLLPQGTGLANDGSAVWTEKRRNRAGVIVGRVAGATPGAFTAFRRSLHQLSGDQVDALAGGISDAHVVAGAARSMVAGAGSSWAVQLRPPDGADSWLNPTDAAARHGATDVDGQGWTVGNRQRGLNLVSCYWENPDVTAPVDLPLFGFETATLAVSPTMRRVAGFWNTMEGTGPRRPWYGTVNGPHSLTYVDGIVDGVAHDINDDVMSCGKGTLDDASQIAWRWSPARGTRWLREFSAGGVAQAAAAYSLNRYGETVGQIGDRAAYWPAYTNNATDLTARIGQPDLHLTAAVRINDNLEILCVGRRTSSDGKSVNKIFLVRHTGLRLSFLTAR